MGEALLARPQLSAIACVDTRTDVVLGASMRSDELRERVSDAALSAHLLCSVPRLDDPFEESARGDEALVVSSCWMHAYVRVPQRPHLVVVGLIQESTNAALLLAWVKEVAAAVPAKAG